MRIDDRSGLPGAELAELTAQIGAFATLAEVLRWGFAAEPPRLIDEVVVQDEYTQDVVLPWKPGRWLVFDST